MPSFSRFIFILIIAAAVAIGASALVAGDSEEIALNFEEQPERQSNVVVYVTGAVKNPGIVELPGGGRIEQAVFACGGALPQADIESINLARPLEDGMQIKVPVLASDASDAEDPGLVNINRADEKALSALPGVGTATAKRIVEYRREHGVFKSPGELKNVKGIGESKYEKLKDRITI